MRARFLLVLIAGLLCLAPARSAWAEEKEKDGEKKEGAEVKVKIDQVPQAVRQTLADESKGAKIDEVDKESDEGKTIYEADVKLNGHNYEIRVAEDGTLVCKKLDEGEEKKGKEKDEKDEKPEKK